MKAFLFSILGIFFSVYSNATSLQCEIKSNLTSVMKVEVQTASMDKTWIGEFNTIRTYVTEKQNDHFVVEAFLPDYEMRIYAEGDLKSDANTLTASYWGRDNMLDVSCHRLEK